MRDGGPLASVVVGLVLGVSFVLLFSVFSSNTTGTAYLSYGNSNTTDRLVFSTIPTTGSPQIFLINTDGTGLTNLTNDDMWPSSLRVSPDKKKIAYLSSETRGAVANLHVMNIDGTDKRQLTENGAPGAFFVWSPDSSRIVFSSSVEGQAQIVMLDLNGNITRITNDGIYSFRPMWSSNNTINFERIFFDEYNAPKSTSLVEMDINGSYSRTVIEEYDENALVWNYILAPDLSKVVFVKVREATDGYYDFIYSVHVADADGSNARKLADRLWYLDLNMQWSPDSSQIVFEGARYFQTTSRIYIADVNTGLVRALTNSNTHEFYPIWSSTGRLAFIKDVGEYYPEIHVTDENLTRYQNVTVIRYPIGPLSVDWLD